MELMEAVRGRRSVGRLEGEIADAELRTLLEAALWAPNHRLTEPWRFTVVRGAARERLGDVWAQVVDAETTLSGSEREARLRKERGKPLRAPVLIVASTRTDDEPVVAAEDFAATAAAVQNLLLAAHELGLGAMWRTGEMAYRREIKLHLGLAANDRIVAVVYLGRPAMEPPKARARDFTRAVRWLE